MDGLLWLCAVHFPFRPRYVMQQDFDEEVEAVAGVALSPGQVAAIEMEPVEMEVEAEAAIEVEATIG